MYIYSGNNYVHYKNIFLFFLRIFLHKNYVLFVANINKLTLLEAAAQAYVFFLAGFETSSTTATYCLYELAQHQDLQNKVRTEIDEILNKHGELTYNAVNEMTYLHKVVNGNYDIQLFVWSTIFYEYQE